MSRAAMQQALDAIEGSGCKADLMAAADALRAALAEQAQPVAWRYKPMVGSPWSLSDDGYYVSCKRDNGYIVQSLYTTPPAPQPLRDLCAAAYQVVGVAGGPVEMLDNLWAAAEGKPLPHDPGAGLPWSQPSPQPLSGLDVERLLEDVVGSLPVARKLIRAVEAEVLKRVGVRR